MVRAKVDAESRLSEEKKTQERKRNLVILCACFMREMGYTDSVKHIQTETNISLDKWDGADNIDLLTILTEYEDFYEMRFGRKPKLVRKMASDEQRKPLQDRQVSLPRLPTNARGLAAAVASGQDFDPGPPPPAPDPGAAKRERSQSRKRDKDGGKESGRGSSRPPVPDRSPSAQEEPAEAGLGLEVGGQNVAKGQGAGPKKDPKDPERPVKPEEAGDEFFENRMLRALPDFGGDKEYRDLAITISRDILSKNPGVPWTSIVGLDHAKQLLKEAVVMPLKYPQLFTGLLTPWKGVLLFGPPGTGKTLLAKAVATECETTFFNISASTLVSKWRGDSEKLIRVLFDLARHYQPSTIFVDELDSVMSSRGGGDGEHEGSRRMKTELLIQLDGLARDVKDQVFLLAASNLPWDLDSAMLRRLEKRILVDLPNAEARESMLKCYLPSELVKDIDYSQIAGLTSEWSGSDIRLLCKEAAMHPLRRLMADLEVADSAAVRASEQAAAGRGTNKQRAVEKAKAEAQAVINDLKVGPVTEEDTMLALKTVHPAPAANQQRYCEWQEQFGAA